MVAHHQSREQDPLGGQESPAVGNLRIPVHFPPEQNGERREQSTVDRRVNQHAVYHFGIIMTRLSQVEKAEPFRKRRRLRKHFR